MVNGILVRLEVKPGKRQIVADFVKSALPLAEQETYSINGFAFRLRPSTFSILCTFENEEGRNAHPGGDIALALMANASDLLASDPSIQKIKSLWQYWFTIKSGRF